MGALYLGTTKLTPAITAEGQSEQPSYQEKAASITHSGATEITPDSGYDAMTKVTVTPQLQSKTVSPSTSQQTVSPDSGKAGLSSVTVNAVTSAIDSNIKAANIKSGVSILGVSGTYTPQLQSKTVSPSTSQQTVSPDSGKDGLSSVTVNAVTSAIDSNIKEDNIKEGISILGVLGTFAGASGGGLQLGTATASASSRSTSLNFTGLSGTPRAFFVIQASSISSSTSYSYVNAMSWDGTTHRLAYNAKRTTLQVSTSYGSHTFSNGTLNVKTSSSTNGGYFYGSYQLIYLY